MTSPGQPGDNNNPYNPTPGPYQQPPQKKRKVWPWVVIGVPILLIGACTAVIAASVGGDSETSVTKASAQTSAEAPAAGEAKAPAEADDQAGPEFPGKLDDDTAAVGGDTITHDDLAYTVTPLESSESDFGNYLCSSVTIKNVGSKQNDFNGYLDWSLLDATGTIRDATFAFEKQQLNSGKLAPGGQTAGDICFEARDGAGPGTYVVLFEDMFSLSSDRLAWVNTL